VKQIVITGPKHSGKTNAGKALAKLVKVCEFIDLDELIFQKTGKTPRQIFTESEETFKKIEAEIVAELLHNHPLDKRLGNGRIIAAGGGIIDNPDAMAALEEARKRKPADGFWNTIVIYLDISAGCAWGRITQTFSLQTGVELPPFLQTENPQETHRILHERRSAAYRQIAGVIIEAEEKSPEQIADEIAEITSFSLL
jgi:shikimate kinase